MFQVLEGSEGIGIGGNVAEGGEGKEGSEVRLCEVADGEFVEVVVVDVTAIIAIIVVAAIAIGTSISSKSRRRQRRQRRSRSHARSTEQASTVLAARQSGQSSLKCFRRERPAGTAQFFEDIAVVVVPMADAGNASVAASAAAAARVGAECVHRPEGLGAGVVPHSQQGRRAESESREL